MSFADKSNNSIEKIDLKFTVMDEKLDAFLLKMTDHLYKINKSGDMVMTITTKK